MTHLRELITHLADAQVDFVIGGGVACVLQGVERFTMDNSTKRILESTSSDDFDGHTEFVRMTPDQRLAWLDEANATYPELHALANPALRVAEDGIPYGDR